MSEGSHRSSPAARGSAGLAVVTPHAVVLLPGGAPTRVVEDLWRILADPATTAEAVVAALPLRGADEVVSFAVIVHEAVGSEGARLQVVLRGDAVVDADVDGDADARRVDARRAQPFYLATLDRVRAYRAGRADAEAGATASGGLPLIAGAVAADAVDWRLGDARSGDAAGAHADRRGRSPSARHAAPPVDPGSVDPGLVATVLDGPADPGEHAGGPDAREAEAEARAGSAGVPTVAMPAAPAAAEDADADAARVIHAFRILRDGVPHVDAVVPDRIPLDAPAIVGRRPRPPRVVRGVAPRLVAVPSPLGEISGTHLGLRQDAGVIVVTDLDSTNGTVVLAPGAEHLALRPGESLVVVPGTRIDIGDGVVLEILSAR
ncbi:FHA domain-containing protein [Clavibacter michiganensis]|uniref:FHA domain-containing protein n=2 Tax=Clavibacter michiganensis TaxID=28447 RepID=UPI00136568DD|nr:FHA domain-containing protein [Clavibacter michiganensis]MDO4031553.1 FHA domain-containing protein [Clavibacter michiganensis]MDO4081164.1 FHA domain-containing protein [Clavibacter michiganensis]MDO4086470.1 FHA domain-containing protein [Clavibacter michiganensis]MDO4097037.1 FHA domain-containing protein [Clavibacter michiganensis]MWJ03826.1 FHA domain-containing protein [Clavibacter michiganensis subsp. michiganensis]